MLLLDSDQYSNYNGLQVTFNLRQWHHVSVNGFYTLSKTMTSVQLQNNTTQGLAQNYSKLERGLRPRRHRSAPRLQHERELGARLLQRRQRRCSTSLNGWTLAPIIKLRSGLPFTITNGNVDANLDGNTNDRAQLIGDPHIDNPTAAHVVQYGGVRAEPASSPASPPTATRRATCSTVRASASSIWRCRATSGLPGGPG